MLGELKLKGPKGPVGQSEWGVVLRRGAGAFEVLCNQPSEGAQIVFFDRLDDGHKKPDSGELQYKSDY